MVNVARDEYGKVLEGYLRSRLRLAPVSALLALYVPYSLPSPINTQSLLLRSSFLPQRQLLHDHQSQGVIYPRRVSTETPAKCAITWMIITRASWAGTVPYDCLPQPSMDTESLGPRSGQFLSLLYFLVPIFHSNRLMKGRVSRYPPIQNYCVLWFPSIPLLVVIPGHPHG